MCEEINRLINNAKKELLDVTNQICNLKLKGIPEEILVSKEVISENVFILPGMGDFIHSSNLDICFEIFGSQKVSELVRNGFEDGYYKNQKLISIDLGIYKFTELGIHIKKASIIQQVIDELNKKNII
mgnify:CR=1 FL=1